MFERLKLILLAPAAILAVLPTASLAASLISMPPDFDKFLSFCAAVAGPILFFLLFLARDRLLRLPDALVVGLIAATTVTGLITAWSTYRYTIERIEMIPYDDGKGSVERHFVVPGKLSPELDAMVNGKHSGIWENAILDGGETVIDQMRRDSLPQQRNILLLFLSAQGLLIFGLLLAGWAALRQQERSEAAGPRRQPE